MKEGLALHQSNTTRRLRVGMVFAPNCGAMTATYLSTFLGEAIIIWLAMLSMGVVAYLFYLQIKEMRRNRRMDAIRARLGLRRA